MIQEAYVSFEVAKLLKEKGFNEPTTHWYNIKGNLINDYEVSYKNFYGSEKVWLAPTHQMAMAWLREEKLILIFIVPAQDGSGNFSYMADVLTWNEDEGLYESTWCTADYVYEKAVEAALKYSLENLI